MSLADAFAVVLVGVVIYVFVLLRGGIRIARKNDALVLEVHQLRNFLATARLVVAALRDAHREGKTDGAALSLASAWIEQLDLHTEAHEEKRLAALAALHRAEDGRR